MRRQIANDYTALKNWTTGARRLWKKEKLSGQFYHNCSNFSLVNKPVFQRTVMFHGQPGGYRFKLANHSFRIVLLGRFTLFVS